MKTTDINILLIEGYLKLLNNLSPSIKLDLISGLTQSVKMNMEENENRFSKSFGAWESEDEAEMIIESIMKNRTFNRQTEKL